MPALRLVIPEQVIYQGMARLSNQNVGNVYIEHMIKIATATENDIIASCTQGNVRFNENGTRIYPNVRVLQYQRKGKN